MVTRYYTFGVQYAREQHPTLPYVHPDGYLTVVAPTAAMCRKVAFMVTDGAFAFDYIEPPDPKHFPRGELGRITFHVNPAGEV